MTLCLHELRKSRVMLIVWSAALSFMLGMCILIYPEMSSQMNEVSDMFADMGSFSSAFGMDQANFGEFMGFFAIECGNTLGIGGVLFAALAGITAISSEQRDGTAEFLLTHPITRTNVVTQKLCAVFIRILLMNITAFAVSLLCILAINAQADFGKLSLIFLSYFLMQLETAAVTFGVSPFVKNGAPGVGLGIGFAFYFINIMANLDDKLKALKFLTPFAYADGTSIMANGAIELKYLAVGAVFTASGIIAAYVAYRNKDIT